MRFMGTTTFTLLLAFYMATSAWATHKRVLVVHSYHETQENHVVPMTEGIQNGLEGMELDIRFYHMDTKRNTSEEWKQQAGAEASKLVDDFKPDLVITMDDNAQKYFASDYANRPGAPVFVFAGVNAKPDIYGFPADNVTGVLERPNITESIELLQKIVPSVKKIALLTDHSETSKAVLEYIDTLHLPVEVVTRQMIATREEWRRTITDTCSKVDAFGFYVLRTITEDDNNDHKVAEEDLITEYYSLCDKPTTGFFDSAARAGALCGVSVSMREQGYSAGRIAREILLGKKPGDFPPQPTSKGRIQLNLIVAEKLGIDINYNVIKRADVLIREP